MRPSATYDINSPEWLVATCHETGHCTKNQQPFKIWRRMVSLCDQPPCKAIKEGWKIGGIPTSDPAGGPGNVGP